MAQSVAGYGSNSLNGAAKAALNLFANSQSPGNEERQSLGVDKFHGFLVHIPRSSQKLVHFDLIRMRSQWTWHHWSWWFSSKDCVSSHVRRLQKMYERWSVTERRAHNIQIYPGDRLISVSMLLKRTARRGAAWNGVLRTETTTYVNTRSKWIPRCPLWPIRE